MVGKQRRTRPRQRAGLEASRRIRTSRFPPRPRGGSAGALKVGAWSPVALARPLLAPVREPQPAAAPEPWGHGITCPGRGRRGGGIERSRRAPCHRAVIERSAGPPLSRLLTAHAAVHSFIPPSTHPPFSPDTCPTYRRSTGLSIIKPPRDHTDVSDPALSTFSCSLVCFTLLNPNLCYPTQTPLFW